MSNKHWGARIWDRLAERNSKQAATAKPNTAEPVAKDDPNLDGTDAAHPAWWRGHDETTAVFCQKVNEIIDGKDDGRGVSNEPWESVRRRLLALAALPAPETDPEADEAPLSRSWRALVNELANDLESEIENRRAGDLPRRIERDLEIVRTARKRLSAAPLPPTREG